MSIVGSLGFYSVSYQGPQNKLKIKKLFIEIQVERKTALLLMRYSIDKEQDRYRVSSISENHVVGLLESMAKQCFSEYLLLHVYYTQLLQALTMDKFYRGCDQDRS